MSLQQVTLPAEEITLKSSSGEKETISCKPVTVLCNEQGIPLVQRIELDKFNNLKILISPHAFRMQHCETWVSVEVEESVCLAVVKDAS